MGVVHAVEEGDALGRLVHAADDVELGGLAEENEEPALAHVEARALDDLHDGLSGAVGPLHAAKRDDDLLLLGEAQVAALVVDGDCDEHGEFPASSTLASS